MKQRILCAVLAGVCAMTLLCTAVPISAQAQIPPDDTGDAVIENIETRWYYRRIDGVREKRLWSITEGRWLTAWLPA